MIWQVLCDDPNDRSQGSLTQIHVWYLHTKKATSDFLKSKSVYLLIRKNYSGLLKMYLHLAAISVVSKCDSRIFNFGRNREIALRRRWWYILLSKYFAVYCLPPPLLSPIVLIIRWNSEVVNVFMQDCCLSKDEHIPSVCRWVIDIIIYKCVVWKVHAVNVGDWAKIHHHMAKWNIRIYYILHYFFYENAKLLKCGLYVSHNRNLFSSKSYWSKHLQSKYQKLIHWKLLQAYN